MKDFLSHILAVILPLSFILSGCEKEYVDAQQEDKRPAVYLELIKAYEEDAAIEAVEFQTSCCVITFEDGYRLTVSDSVLDIRDCSASEPATVQVVNGWWSINGIVKGIRADDSQPRKDAEPVYQYYDGWTLHMILSNREELVFRSLAWEEYERQQAELARKQTIPVVRILTDGGAGIYDKQNYVPGTITIEDPVRMYSDDTLFVSRMGIRGRGNSTWSWEKKPWKVKLEDKAGILGMPKDKEWALLANYADRTLLRNIVAMKLSEICGFSWTPRIRSVEVYLNDDYQGVYSICEHKKVSSDRVDIDVIEETVTEGDALTGGYYLEMEENQDETTCWWTAMGVPMMFSEPEVPNEAQYAYVTGLIDEFETVLRSEGFADSLTGYAAYIDVPSFINYFIVQELTKNVDGNLRKSSFITKERGKKMEMYHLWDFDLTLGNCGYFDWRVGNGPENFWVRDYASNSTYGGGWFWYLFRDPAFVEAVRERWNELMPELESIPYFIDDQALSLEKAAERNFQKWDINASVDWVMFPSLGSYEAEVKYLKDFYTARLGWLDRELKKL